MQRFRANCLFKSPAGTARAFGKTASVLLICFGLTVGVALAQTTDGRIVAIVTDQSGAVVVGAQLELVDQATNSRKTGVTGSDGRYVFLALPNGLYTLKVSTQGFKAAVYPNIKVDVGRTSEVAAKLAVGDVTAEVAVEASGEVLQSQTSAIEGTVGGRTIRSLPLNNRDVLDFVMLMPGAQQGGTARQSTYEGLPKGALSVTMDGVNVQDNLLKSSSGGGMFTLIRPKMDAVEEISVTSATPGADAGGDGAVQIKFVTRRGTNTWHGGVFEQYRDQGLNANTFFNNRQGLPRPTNHLNQYGFHVGGPLIANKLFIFTNWEDFKLPAAQNRKNNILNPAASTGVFTYRAGGVTRQANLLNIAAACTTCGPTPLPSTIDPVVASQLNTIASTFANGRVSSVDLNRNSLNWNASGNSRRYFTTVRTDYDINSKLRWNVVGNWNHFDSAPDLLNSMDPSFPGLKQGGGQYGRRWSLVTGLNWTITPTTNYEFRLGRTSSIVRFFPESTIADNYPLGFRLLFPSALSVSSLNTRPGSSTTTRGLPSFRDSPILTNSHNFGWVHGKHTVGLGGQIEVLTNWDKSFGNAGVPNVTVAMASTDPAANAFSNTAGSGSLPGASNTDLTNARALYAMLTGRIFSISGNNNVDEITHQYVPFAPLTDRNRQNMVGLYITDSFRAFQSLTVNYGVRWDYQGAAYNRNGIYTSPTYADLWGQSGVGNLFKPGTLAGIPRPQIQQRSQGTYDPGFKNFAPSFGLAWSPHLSNAAWKLFFGGPGKTVFRGGYSISYTREGLQNHLTFDGGSPGQTQSISLNPGDAGFAAGGLAVSRPLPTLRRFPTSFSFPVSQSLFTFGNNSLFGVDPSLRVPYVQSWSFGIQRELDQNTVLEVRYVGNRGTRLWRGNNINEVNIFENGFLDEFNRAKQNLDANRGRGCGAAFNPQTGCGTNAVPILTAAFGSPTSPNFRAQTFIDWLDQGQAGAFANNLAGTSTLLCNLVGNRLPACADGSSAARSKTAPGPYPANFFQVNPDNAGANVWLLRNGAFSSYNSLQVELRRRMAKGLQINANYVWSHSLTDLFADSASNQVNLTTMRNPRLDRGPSPWDLRHSARVWWIYELPFGPGRRWTTSNVPLNKVLEGWEVLGIVAVQSGRVFKLTSGRNTVNQFESGVVLKGITAAQLQNKVDIGKQFDPNNRCSSKGSVFFLPTGLIDASCQSNTTVIDSPVTPGWFGRFVYLTGPRFVKPDLAIAKKTKITERVGTEFRAQFFNAFNYSNFMVGAPGSGGITHNINTGGFGTTREYFNDIGNQDQGPRMVELVFRINF